MSPSQGSSKKAAAEGSADEGGQRRHNEARDLRPDAPPSTSSLCYTTPSSRPDQCLSYSHQLYPYPYYPYGYDPHYSARHALHSRQGTAASDAHHPPGPTAALHKKDATGSFITPDASRDIQQAEMRTPTSTDPAKGNTQPLSHASQNSSPGTFRSTAAPLSSPR